MRVRKRLPERLEARQPWPEIVIGQVAVYVREQRLRTLKVTGIGGG